MPTDPNRFLSPAVATLAKRAAQQCSNPYCDKFTSGPTDAEDKSLITGEAAHIQGANPTSARHDPEMKPEQRRNITNGIWLCGFCAKLIDSDEQRYSVDVLYRWKREHEEKVRRSQNNAPGENERRLLLRMKFESESPAAMQLVLDEPEYWQYFALIELVRDRVRVNAEKRARLRSGLVFLGAQFIDLQKFHTWLIERTRELHRLFGFLVNVIETKLRPAVSLEPPDALAILDAAQLIGTVCDGLFAWDCGIAGAVFPAELGRYQEQMLKWTDGLFQQIAQLPEAMAKPLVEKISGTHNIQIVLALPENFERVSLEMMSLVADLV